MADLFLLQRKAVKPVEELKALYDTQLSEAPKRASQTQQTGYSNDLGWVYLCNDFTKPKAVRTYQTLFKAQENYTYFTPNTFYRNDRREAATLRWINAFSIDIDVKNEQNNGLTFPDLIDLIDESGLPTPTLIVATPSGGFHIHWYLHEPRRAYPNVIEEHKKLQRAIAQAVQGDVLAVGPERWFRLPNQRNTLFRSSSRISFNELREWRELQEDESSFKENIKVGKGNLIEHPAIQKLLAGVSEGQRDNTCYTLALALKASGYTQQETLDFLHSWNEKNDPPMRSIDVERKVKSAYKEGAPLGPSSYWINTLSGMPFKYQAWEAAKPREDRSYSHLEEWKTDILAVLQQNGGCISGAQRELIQMVRSSADRSKTISYTTFKRLITLLVEEGLITKHVEGKGRNARTTLTIVKCARVYVFPRRAPLFNGPNSNTYIDAVVGGPSFVWVDIVWDST